MKLSASNMFRLTINSPWTATPPSPWTPELPDLHLSFQVHSILLFLLLLDLAL